MDWVCHAMMMFDCLMSIFIRKKLCVQIKIFNTVAKGSTMPDSTNRLLAKLYPTWFASFLYDEN